MIKLTLVLTLAATSLAAQVTAGVYHRCPLGGTVGTASRIQALNRQKNRATLPATADIDTAFSMMALLARGNDAHRFTASKAGELTAYVIDVKPGGVESVNCDATDPVYRDTHIELATSLTAPEREWVIVEVTPRWRAFMKSTGADWSTSGLRTLKGRHVRFRGWIFADTEHDPQARNTAPENVHDWRATIWELHPVTSFTVLP